MTEARPFRRRVFVSTAAVGAGNLWAIVVSLVTLPLVLHGLGAVAFGTWVLLSTFSASSGWFSIADAGIGTATTREVARRAAVGDLRGAQRAASSAFVVFAAVGVVCAGVFAAAGRVGLPHLFDTPHRLVAPLQFAVLVYAVQVVFDQFTNAVESILDGLQRVDLSRGLDAIRRTTVAVAVAGAAMAHTGLRGVASASLGGAVLGALAAAVFLHRASPGWRVRPARADIRSLLAYAKVVALLQPIGVITRQMDRLIVGAVLGPAAVALVEIATQILNGSMAILGASAYVATPASSWVEARDEPGLLRELALRGTKYSLLLTYPVTVGAMLVSTSLVHVWVGPKFAAAAGLAVLALADTLVSGPVQVCSNILMGVGRASVIFRATIVGLVINLVASLVLVHHFGIAGVFVGTLIALAFLVPAIGLPACRILELRPAAFLRAAVLPAASACLPLVAVGLVLTHVGLPALAALAGASVAGAVVYAATVWRFALAADERGELRSLLSRGAAAAPPA